MKPLMSNSPEVMGFLTALGLDLKRVTNVVITISPNEIVTVAATAILFDADTKAFTPIINNYKLVPHETND
jgi:hypothetical protein